MVAMMTICRVPGAFWAWRRAGCASVLRRHASKGARAGTARGAAGRAEKVSAGGYSVFLVGGRPGKASWVGGCAMQLRGVRHSAALVRLTDHKAVAMEFRVCTSMVRHDRGGGDDDKPLRVDRTKLHTRKSSYIKR